MTQQETTYTINMKKCGIYKIVSPSGKIYIGQSIDIDRRKGSYRRQESCIKKQVKLYNSIKKHGWERHIFEIVEECLTELLNERERYWQEFYNSNSKNNLNLCLVSTADKKQLHSEETVNKISNWQKEFHKTNKNRMFGKKHKTETKQMIAKKAKERYKYEPNPNCKKCYCIETGKEWNSVKKCWEDIFKGTYSYSYLQTMLSGHNKNKTSIRKVNNMDDLKRITYTKGCLELLGYKCTTPDDKDLGIYEGKNETIPSIIDANSNYGFLNNWNWIIEVVTAIKNFSPVKANSAFYAMRRIIQVNLGIAHKEGVVHAIHKFLIHINE